MHIKLYEYTSQQLKAVLHVCHANSTLEFRVAKSVVVAIKYNCTIKYIKIAAVLVIRWRQTPALVVHVTIVKSDLFIYTIIT